MAPGSVPFTKKCEGYKRMVEKLENGTIPPDMPPKEAYRSDPLFFQYSETAFKNQLKNWKNENGVGNRRPTLSTCGGGGGGNRKVDCGVLILDALLLKIKTVATNFIVEQNLMAAMLSDKGSCMMEDGINKLASVTPKWDHLAPQLSGAAPKKTLPTLSSVSHPATKKCQR